MEKEFELRSRKAPCLIPGCTKDTYGGSRGLCMSHYAVRQALVKRGRVTWEDLELVGEALPKLTFDEQRKARMKGVRNRRVWSKELERFVFAKESE